MVRLSLRTNQVAHQAGAYPGSVKRPGVFLLLSRWDASPLHRIASYNKWMFIHIPHISCLMAVYNSILSEIGRQPVKAPLAAAISPYLTSLTHPTHAWNVFYCCLKCGRRTFEAFSEWNLRFQIPPAYCVDGTVVKFSSLRWIAAFFGRVGL